MLERSGLWEVGVLEYPRTLVLVRFSTQSLAPPFLLFHLFWGGTILDRPGGRCRRWWGWWRPTS